MHNGTQYILCLILDIWYCMCVSAVWHKINSSKTNIYHVAVVWKFRQLCTLHFWSYVAIWFNLVYAFVVMVWLRKHKGMQCTSFLAKKLHLCMYICGLTWWPWSRSLSLLCWWHRWCKIGASPPPLCHQSPFCMPWSSALDCWDCTVPDSTRKHMIVNQGIYQLKYISATST